MHARKGRDLAYLHHSIPRGYTRAQDSVGVNEWTPIKLFPLTAGILKGKKVKG